MLPVAIAPIMKHIGGTLSLEGLSGTRLLANALGEYNVPLQLIPYTCVPAGRYCEKGFLMTFNSVVDVVPALIFILCRSWTISPEKRLNVLGTRTEG
jgi:hypothetical protein